MEPITSAVILSAVSTYVTKTIVDELAKDIVLSPFKKLGRASYEKRLYTKIVDTVEDFERKYSSKTQSGTTLFYHSHLLFDLLSQHMLFQKDNLARIQKVFESDPRIQRPSEEELKSFYELFVAKVNADGELEKLFLNEHYQKEIFSIRQTVDGLNTKFDLGITNVIHDLNQFYHQEYALQLYQIEEDLIKFRPQTALDDLNKLEQRIAMSPRSDQHIKAKIFYLQGKCNYELNQVEQGAKLLISAYQADRNNLDYQETASFAYTFINQWPQAKALAEQILTQYPYNPTGWAIKVFELEKPLTELLVEVPSLVTSEMKFQTAIGSFLLRNSKLEQAVQYVSTAKRNSSGTWLIQLYWPIAQIRTSLRRMEYFSIC